MDTEMAYRCAVGCSVEAALDVMGGKWKGVVLYHLCQHESLRFSELSRKLQRATQRMLTKQLRELEQDGLISRTVFPSVPPRVEYALTARGESLRPLIAALKAWGDEHILLAPA